MRGDSSTGTAVLNAAQKGNSYSFSLTDQGRKVYEDIDNTFNSYFARVFELIPEFKHNFILESLTLFTNALMKYNVKSLTLRGEEEANP